MLNLIRTKFLNYFAAKNHEILKSFPIIPENDKTLLFINSGMAPLKKYFLNLEKPVSEKICTSQHCLRVGGKHNDLQEVGYTKRHHTFFEMLGNFSFGAYFQKEAIEYAWDFLTNDLNLDKSRLYITVHPKDKEAFAFWKSYVDENRIFLLEENVWSMGEVGPFGHCSEIFYDLTAEDNNIDLSNDNRFLEIWNLVFMQFYSDGKNNFNLEKACVDTGMGLERIVAVLENVDDTYDISFFKKALHLLNLKKHNAASKIFLDHLRSISFIINAKVVPGPNAKEYVLRRLIRRCLKAFNDLNLNNLNDVVLQILTLWQKDYEEKFEIDKIIKILVSEKKSFDAVLTNGLIKFNEFVEKAGQSIDNTSSIEAKDLFVLHDTYGFTSDIMFDLLKEKKINHDFEKFEKILEESRQKNRSKTKLVLPFENKFLEDVDFLESSIIGLHEDEDKNYIILDQTLFYAESGGQAADVGYVEGKGFKLKILDVKKFGKVHAHLYEVEKSYEVESLYENESFDKNNLLNQKVKLFLDSEKRKKTAANHTAAHLLHSALFEILGSDIKQMGSAVNENKLRLDFNYSNEINLEKITEIENLVNAWIMNNYSRQIEIKKLKEAKDSKAFFDYEEDVRIVKFGNVSNELCCGTHVNSTAEIGLFKVIKCSNISAGIKRIEAVTGKVALKLMQDNFNLIKEISELLKIEESKIIDRLKKKEKTAEVKTFKIKNHLIGYSNELVDIEKEMKKLNLSLMLIATVSEDKISLQVKSEIFDTTQIIKHLGSLIEAKGFGLKKNFAQTGGKNIIQIEMIFKSLEDFLKNL